MIYAVLFISIIVFGYYKLYKLHNYWRDKGVKQLKQIYLFGDYAQVMFRKESFFDAMMRLWNSFPDERYFGMYQTVVPTLIIKDPELIKQITIKHFDFFVDHRPFIPDGIDPLWNRNIVSLKGNHWREMRATLSPTFTSSKMRIIFSVMSEVADSYLDHFLKNDDKALILEAKETLTKYANDVTAAVTFGIRCDSLNDENNDFYQTGKKISKAFFSNLNFIVYILPRVCKLVNVKLFPKDVYNFIMYLVKHVKDSRMNDDISRPDMMQLLVDANKKRSKFQSSETNTFVDTGFATAIESDVNVQYQKKKEELSDIDIAAQALIFFGAGFESIAALMGFMAYELAINLEVQRKLQDEIDDTLNKCDGKLTYDELMNMKYLDMVVCETLRKYPSGVAIDRICTKPYTIEPTLPHEKPIHLQVGDIIMVPIGPVHYDPKFFPDPHAFKPERFSDENKDNIIPYTYIPFGSGPRNCIGSRFALLEAKTVFFHLLSKFSLLPTDRTEIPLEIDKKCFNVVPQNGIWVNFKPRNK